MFAEDREEVYKVGTVEWHDHEGEDGSLRLLPEYKPWADVFTVERSEQHPEHGSHDHHMNLVPGTKPPFGPLYPCSDSEPKVGTAGIPEQVYGLLPDPKLQFLRCLTYSTCK
jgi:hypothetical protein